MSQTVFASVASGAGSVAHCLVPAVLADYRHRLEAAWSAGTMHPDFLRTIRPGLARSHGQCGVSSAWLIERLDLDHGIVATYCYGDVVSVPDGSAAVPRHCWVEIGDPAAPDRVVLDVTCDQVPSLSQATVLCEPHDDLVRGRALDYAARVRSTFGQLRQDLVWDRYVQLKKAVDETADRPSL